MQLIHNGARFELICTFAEADQPRAAGFHWDRRAKRWWTGNAEVAKKFEALADGSAISKFQMAYRQIAMSQAVDANIVIPAPPGKTYMGFQKAGVQFALGRPNTLIADDMGLGKTIQVCGVINADPTINNILIIPPASVKLNWQRELEAWLTRPLTIGLATSTNMPKTNIVIANYEIIKKLRADIDKRRWDMIVCDEAHYLKSPDAQRTKAVLGAEWHGKVQSQPIEALRRLFLTGTPILNRPIELWPILRIADPEGLGASHWLYAKKYCGAWESPWGWDFSGATNLPELQARLRSTIMIRRLKTDVLKDLPAKRRQIISIPVEAAAKAAVQREMEFYSKNTAVIEEAVEKAELSQLLGDDDSYKAAAENLKSAKQAMFEEMSLLRKATAMAKLPFGIDYLDDVLQQRDKVVVFAHHRDVVDQLKDKYGDAAVKFYGGMSIYEKDAAVQRFITDPKCKLFIGSITAAGIGVDGLQKVCSFALFMELDWRPPINTQAEDRLSRMGQLEMVQIVHLVFDGSLDSSMVKKVVRKQEIIDKALDEPMVTQ